MSDQVWVAVLAAIPATVAALSSLINGQRINKTREEQHRVADQLSNSKVGEPKSPKRRSGSSKPGFVGDPDQVSDPDWYH
jgi:hypothetical protein